MQRDTMPGEPRILIVDDEEPNVLLLERVLRQAGYAHVVGTTQPEHVLSIATELDPDLILLDLFMPRLDGFSVMEQLGKVIPETTYLPVLVLTADVTPETKRRALAGGAKDFLTKPFDIDEVLLRISNMLEIRRLHLQLQERIHELEQRVQERITEDSDSHAEAAEAVEGLPQPQ